MGFHHLAHPASPLDTIHSDLITMIIPLTFSVCFPALQRHGAVRPDCDGQLNVDGESHQCAMEGTAEDTSHIPALWRHRPEAPEAIGQRRGAHTDPVGGPVPSGEGPPAAAAGDVRAPFAAGQRRAAVEQIAPGDCGLVPRCGRYGAHAEHEGPEPTPVAGGQRRVPGERVVPGTGAVLPGGENRTTYDVERALWHRSRRVHGRRTDNGRK